MEETKDVVDSVPESVEQTEQAEVPEENEETIINKGILDIEKKLEAARKELDILEGKDKITAAEKKVEEDEQELKKLTGSKQ